MLQAGIHGLSQHLGDIGVERKLILKRTLKK
jgi:hypothetical protein